MTANVADIVCQMCTPIVYIDVEHNCEHCQGMWHAHVKRAHLGCRWAQVKRLNFSSIFLITNTSIQNAYLPFSCARCALLIVASYIFRWLKLSQRFVFVTSSMPALRSSIISSYSCLYKRKTKSQKVCKYFIQILKDQIENLNCFIAVERAAHT